MSITNMNIIVFIITGILGVTGLVAGIATLTVHNMVIGVAALGLSICGYITTKRETPM